MNEIQLNNFTNSKQLISSNAVQPLNDSRISSTSPNSSLTPTGSPNFNTTFQTVKLSDSPLVHVVCEAGLSSKYGVTVLYQGKIVSSGADSCCTKQSHVHYLVDALHAKLPMSRMVREKFRLIFVKSSKVKEDMIDNLVDIFRMSSLNNESGLDNSSEL